MFRLRRMAAGDCSGRLCSTIFAASMAEGPARPGPVGRASRAATVAGRQPQDVRRMSRAGSTISRGAASPRASAAAMVAAVRPCSIRRCPTVVIEGTTNCASGILSKPMTETSRGTEHPCSRSASIAPIAVSSLAATSAWKSGRACRAKYWESDCRALARVKSPGIHRSGSSSRPRARSASRYAAKRSCA